MQKKQNLNNANANQCFFFLYFFIFIYIFIFYNSSMLLLGINTYLFVSLILCIIQSNTYTAMLYCMEAHTVVMQQVIVVRDK